MKMAILSERDHIREVGYRLRLLIRAIGISYVEAAADMGVTKNHLGNWMRGSGPYPLEYPLYKFARARGVGLDWVYLGDPSNLPKRVADRLVEVQQEPVDREELERQASEV